MELKQAFSDGLRASEAEVQAWEAALAETPNDAVLRAQITGYWGRHAQSKEDRRRLMDHLLWWTEHMPDAPLLRLAVSRLAPYLGEPEASELLAGWQRVAARADATAATLVNAAWFLQWQEPPLQEQEPSPAHPSTAKELLFRAAEQDPSSPGVLMPLVQIAAGYGIRGMCDDAEAVLGFLRPRLPGLLEHMQPMQRADALVALARALLARGHADEAGHWLQQVLQTPIQDPRLDLPARHDAWQLAGRCALQRGDTAAAIACLQRSVEASDAFGAALGGRMAAPPELSSFGPSMALARDLLQAGETEAVRGYLIWSHRIWEHGRPRVEAWLAAIDRDEMPDFGPNMLY